MSWWRTGRGDDVIGDVPADIIAGTFEIITAGYSEHSGQRPTLQKLLDSIAAALFADPRDFLADCKSTPTRRVVAKPDSRPDIGTSEGYVAADDKMVAAFGDAFAMISEKYEERWGRKPRLQELLDIVAFELRPAPAGLASDTDGLVVREIVPEPRVN